MTKKKVGLALVAAAIVASTLAGWHYRTWLSALSPTVLRDYLLQWGYWNGAAVYFLIYTFSIRPFVPVPPTLYTLAGGLVFGPVGGAILTVLGATANASITFFIGRYFGKEWVKGHLGGKYKTAQDKLLGAGFKTLLLIRLSPVGPPFDLVSYGAGILGIRFRDYFIGTLIGIVPVTTAYSYFGGSLSRGALGVLVAIFGVALLSLVLPRVWKRRGRRAGGGK